jgi:hypothetical protein
VDRIAANHEWMLIETFGGGKPPSLIGVGDKPRSMVSLRAALGRGRYLIDVERVVTAVVATGQRQRTETADGRRIIFAEPHVSFRGHVHGAQIWYGEPEDTPPPLEVAGAWYFNLTTDEIGGSEGLLDLYGVPKGARRTQRYTAEAFGRLLANADEAAALAGIVQAKPGYEHQAVWTVRRDDGDLRAAHFSCRAIAEPALAEDPTVNVVLRGITHDLGPAATTPSAPTPIVLAQQVLAGLATPGEHRAIINIRNLRLLRWLDEPMPGIAWERETSGGDHWIHPADRKLAMVMVEGLARGPQSAHLRFRATGGDWIAVDLTAHLVILDAHTNAALLTLKEPRPPVAGPA